MLFRSLRYQAENEENKAKYQAKTGIRTNYQAKAKAKDQDEAKYQLHQPDSKNPTGMLDRNLAEKKETEASTRPSPRPRNRTRPSTTRPPPVCLSRTMSRRRRPGHRLDIFTPQNEVLGCRTEG